MAEHGGPEPVVGRLELSAPADPAVLDLVHAVLDQLWQAHPDISTADRGRFEIAVVEILGNVMEHAYAADRSVAEPVGADQRRFEICVAATDDDLVAEIEDNGLPMELDLGSVVMPDAFAESGRGLALASAAVDDLDYERRGSRNHWRVRCRRSRG